MANLRIKSFERDSETLYLTDVRGNDIDIPMDGFEDFLRKSGKMLQTMVEHDDSVDYFEHVYKISLEDYFESTRDIHVLNDINEFMSHQEAIKAFDIQPVLNRILSTYKS